MSYPFLNKKRKTQKVVFFGFSFAPRKQKKSDVMSSDLVDQSVEKSSFSTPTCAKCILKAFIGFSTLKQKSSQNLVFFSVFVSKREKKLFLVFLFCLETDMEWMEDNLIAGVNPSVVSYWY